MRFIVISGLSGAGKSVALHTLEDEGFQCIDNLPVEIFEYMVNRIIQTISASGQKIAISIDVRSLRHRGNHIIELLDRLKNKNIETNLIFVDANTETLIRRYNETHRPHPLATDGRTLQEAIDAEIEYLMGISQYADTIITTTGLNQHQLRYQIRSQVCHSPNRFCLTLQSFGFKHSIPPDSNHVFDVRCLPNPYWEPQLRELTGTDERVKKFLESHQECEKMSEQIYTFINFWLPKFAAAGRKTLAVSIGCTGGQHRSVYIVERLYQSLQNHPRCTIEKRHNDI